MALESSIQRNIVNYARSKGLIAIKLSTAGRFGTSGWPDYLFLGSAPVIVFMEMKRLGGKLTPLQERKQGELKGLGFTVHTVDNVKEGKKIIDEALE